MMTLTQDQIFPQHLVCATITSTNPTKVTTRCHCCENDKLTLFYEWRDFQHCGIYELYADLIDGPPLQNNVPVQPLDTTGQFSGSQWLTTIGGAVLCHSLAIKHIDIKYVDCNSNSPSTKEVIFCSV